MNWGHLMKILLIINIYSGRGKIKQNIIPLINYLSKNAIYPTLFFTQNDTQQTFDVIQANKFVDIVICLGGDGTLNEVINGLMQLQEEALPLLAYIPLGTTNDFGRTLALNDNPVQALEQVLKRQSEYIDIGEVNQQYFAYIASFGVFTSTSYDTPQILKNTFGHLAYVLSGIKELAMIEKYQVTVTIDNQVWQDEYIFGAITNTTSIGGILNFDEEIVNLQDGIFELVLIKAPKNLIELTQLIDAISTQTYSNGLISFYHVSQVKLVFEKPLTLTLDGEKSQPNKTFQITNHFKKIPLILTRKKGVSMKKVQALLPDNVSE